MEHMRRRGMISALFLAAAVGAFAQSGASERVPAAFLGFQSREIAASGLDILSDLVMNEIANAPGYALVDRSNLQRLLDEQELGLSDAADPQSAVRIGGLLGAQKLMVGRIGILGNLYLISLSMIDVATGSIERTQTEEFVGSLEDLRKPVRIAAQKILGIEGIEVNQGEFINVVTEPAGVSVYVNGLFEGSSPVKVRVPKPGKHTVKLFAEGYRSWTQTVAVDENSTYFVNARLLKEEKPVDPRVKALQDGRVPFIIYATLFAGGASEALLYTFGSGALETNPEAFQRLAIGLPLVVAPIAFYGTLKATERIPMNTGRTFMIISSSLWGSTWGITASLAFSAGGGSLVNMAPFAGLSVAGGLLYGALATVITAGTEPFPASRAWLFNLGSALGSLLGLGVPLMFAVNQQTLPGVYYASVLTGSLAGSALSLYLTRDLTQGRSMDNLEAGAAVTVSPKSASLGLPVLGVVPLVGGRHGTLGLGVSIPLVSIRY